MPLPVPLRAGIIQRQGVLLPLHPPRGGGFDDAAAGRGVDGPAIHGAAEETCGRKTVPGVSPVLQSGTRWRADARWRADDGHAGTGG